MSSTLRGFLIGIAVVIAGLSLFVGGMTLGRSGWGIDGYGMADMMLGSVSNAYAQDDTGPVPYDYDTTLGPCGYVGVGGFGHGMMGGFGRMGGRFGPGMMGTTVFPCGDGDVGIMQGNVPYNDVVPLSLEEAEGAVEDYLAAWRNDDLIVAEVMIFGNHAYAEVVEESTGIGAFEVLVDPITLTVYPEPGPNMMWNTKYGHISGSGMWGNSRWMRRGMMGSGGMMGLNGRAAAQDSAEMPVSPEEAIDTAQRYLDRYLPGTQVEHEADAFYGYYTLHITRDGQTIRMLSVNGYTQQVFPHTWHGDFLEMSEDAHSD
jgi:hypothetical protein